MLFDKLLLLSRGSTVYGGTVAELPQYLARHGYEMPQYTNPAEYALDLVNTDFAGDQTKAESKLQQLLSHWNSSTDQQMLQSDIEVTKSSHVTEALALDPDQRSALQRMTVPVTLIHRSFIKSYRDVFTYGIRIAMYVCLAIMSGTVWLRLDTSQENIQAFTNTIFFGGAFMSFMAVAYIPAYMEDRSVYLKERANGLYGPTAFLLSNFLIGLVFLMIITIFYAVVVYWLTNYHPTARAFWVLVMWLYLDLLAAESLVILVTNICPIFIVSLAAVAFANGLWMCVGGFMVQPHALNVFYRYVFHYIDYQAYVFQGMMVNEFNNRVYNCDRLADGSCHCLYVTELQGQCQIDGRGVLDAYGYNPDKTGLWVGIMIGIIAGYRLLGWLVLMLRKN
jgi:ABC-type multidrug transport system permease subunit